MEQITWREKFRYWFDNVMSRGPLATITLLFLASLGFITVIGLLVTAFGFAPKGEDGKPQGLADVVWGNLMRTLDSGTMGSDTGWGFRIFMLVVTLGGVFVVASLIGIISSAFDEKIEELKKGRSKVLESEHTLILGWNNQIFSILNEICMANESRNRPAIVVLSQTDKTEMEQAIRERVNAGKTRIICRNGNPMDLNDLELGNFNAARSIVILASDDDENPDSSIIKTTLALTNHPKRRQAPFHIVAEIRHPDNLEAAHLVGKDEAHFILAKDLISRITVQTCRQSGLSVVYTELLDFGGDEIYFSQQPDLKTYKEAQMSFQKSSVMGFTRDGVVQLNPPADTALLPNDELIVIAEDDSLIARTSPPSQLQISAIAAAANPTQKPEKTLILGYNATLSSILYELDQYVAPNSQTLIVANTQTPEVQATNQKITFEQRDPTNRAVLESLEPYLHNHIIVLSSDSESVQASDAHTLITLLHLRDIANKRGEQISIVSEMKDARNRELAEVTKADDFIVSDQLISLMLSQIAENKQLAQVFSYLFSKQGAEIYLRPAELYIKQGQTVDFYTILEAAKTWRDRHWLPHRTTRIRCQKRLWC
ncbi:MAG: CASTOR/POLLUX-related putative ion channel [Deinococcales bacterium]